MLRQYMPSFILITMRNSCQITPSSTIDYTVPMPSGNYAQAIEGKCRAQSIITLLQKRINYFKKYENHISNRIDERVNKLSKVILVQQNAQKVRHLYRRKRRTVIIGAYQCLLVRVWPTGKSK